MTVELRNSKITRLPNAPDGRQRFALDCSIGAVQMREAGGEWQDIKPRLVKDTEGWHAEGTPYALKILDDGTRTIYPDRTDLGKYIHLPAPAMLQGLPKRIEGNKLIFYTPVFEVAYQLTNTGIQFMILFIKPPIPFDRITLDAEAVGLDIDKLLATKIGLGIPRPRLIDSKNVEGCLDWSYEAGKLKLGFGTKGLKFPILLKNTTIDKDVGADADDAWAYNTNFDNTTQIRMGREGSADIRAFARFTGVTIPEGATIGANCYASFFVWLSTQPGLYIKIKADDSANPSAPTDATEVFAITPTTAGVDWDDQADVDDWANTPDIQSVIAELQASYDYSAGAAITIIGDNDGSGNDERLYMRSWLYNDHSLAPKLHIEYTVGGGEAHEKSLSDTVAIGDSISKAFGAVKADSVGLADVIGKASGLAKADSVAISDSISKAISLIKSDSVAIVDVISKGIGLIKTDTIAIADTFTRVVNYIRAFADNVSISDAIGKAISIAKSDVMAITDSMIAALGVTHILNLFDTVVITDSFSGALRVKTYLRQRISRMGIQRLNISRMPFYRWIIRRFS